MPSARHASTASPRRPPRSAPRRHPRPRGVAVRTPVGRIRWDRVGRIALLVVFAVVAGLYFQDGLSWIGAKREADRQAAIVRRLQRANAGLQAQAQSLQDPVTIQRDARALGMVQSGEHPYVLTGLSKR
jgi:cell division protein FtsB